MQYMVYLHMKSEPFPGAGRQVAACGGDFSSGRRQSYGKIHIQPNYIHTVSVCKGALFLCAGSRDFAKSGTSCQQTAESEFLSFLRGFRRERDGVL